jgi:hypothetical protein
MILVSSRVMGALDDPDDDESDAVETVRDEDAEDLSVVVDGVVDANAAVDVNVVVVELNGTDWPSARGIWMSLMSARSDAYARSDDSSSSSACVLFDVAGCAVVPVAATATATAAGGSPGSSVARLVSESSSSLRDAKLGLCAW